MSKMPKSVERFQAEHNPADVKNKALWIDYARDDEMKRQMNVIEKKKGVNAILLSIFEEVGAWTSFPTPPGVDYLALLLSTHLKRDARFRLTRFLLHNGCNPIRISLWYKTRGMLIDHKARLDVKALLDAFPLPYNPDGKNYHIPGTVSRRTAEPNFERIVEERWCTTSLTGGFTYANGIMDDILARAVSILMFNSNAEEAGRFSVPPGDHLSLVNVRSMVRVEKASETYEAARDRFAALTEAPSEPYDGLKWIVDLAMIPPSPPCSPPGSPTPPASPMMDVEEDPPPLPLPPSALSLLADVSYFKAELDDRTTSLQAAVIAAQKERDDESAALKASVKHMHGTMELVVWTFDAVLKADGLNQLAEKKLRDAESATTRCFPFCKVVVGNKKGYFCCLETCDATFNVKVKASTQTFGSIALDGSLSKAETEAFMRKLVRVRGSLAYTAPDNCVKEKLDTLQLAVAALKRKYLVMNAQRNKEAMAAFSHPS